MRQATMAATAHAARSSGDFSQRYCLVVVPTYNEAMNIERLVGAVLDQGPQFDVLVVDDGSPDGTGDLVAALAVQSPRVQLLRRAGKLGLGTAYIAGFRHGLGQGYRYICEMDADFSHQPHYLPLLLTCAEREADVALGSRNVPGGRVENWSPLRQALSRGGSLYVRAVLGLPVHDCTGGFKCFRSEVLRRIDLGAITSSGYAFQVELNYRCHQAGFRTRELPIVFPDRVAGHSKLSRRIVAEALLLVLRLRFSPIPVVARSAPEPAIRARKVNELYPGVPAEEVLGRTWETYKGRFIEGGRVIDPARGGATTSEGQSYALLRAVYMDDREAFVQVWVWTKANLQRPDGLLAWLYGARDGGEPAVIDIGTATDGDQDTAFALLLAARRWAEPSYVDRHVRRGDARPAVWWRPSGLGNLRPRAPARLCRRWSAGLLGRPGQLLRPELGLVRYGPTRRCAGQPVGRRGAL